MCPRIQSSSSRSRRRPVGPRVPFILTGGSLGKAGAHQEEKGLPTHALEAKSGNSFRARKTCRPLPFPDAHHGATHPPRSRNYACRIESSRHGGRSLGDELSRPVRFGVTFKSPERPVARKNFIRMRKICARKRVLNSAVFSRLRYISS